MSFLFPSVDDFSKITYEGMQRIERYFLSEDALRKALLNALCHKQYQSVVPVQISVYEDKLYIANCGCLPENWALGNLMRKHASSPYNPKILTSLTYSTWPDLLKAGGVELKKFAQPVKMTVCRSLLTASIPVIL